MLYSLLESRRSNQLILVNQGNKPWLFIGRIALEAEAPALWWPDVNSWLFGKDPDAGKGWRQEKGMTEAEMVGWHPWLSGHGFEQLQKVMMDSGA